MTTQKITLLLASSLLGSFAFAQEPIVKEAPKRRAAPAQAADAAPGARKGPQNGQRGAVFLPQSEILRQTVWAKVGDENVDLGAVANLVIDGTNGSVSHVVIKASDKSAEPGKLRAIPFTGLGWSMNPEGKPQAMLSMEARAFEAMPAFDPKAMDQLAGASAMDAAAKRIDKATKGKGAEETADAVKKAREASAGAARSVLASNLAGLQVFAPSEREPFGAAANLVIDCTAGKVAFAEVAVADANYLVPFQILKVRSVPGAEGAAPTLSVVAPTNAEGMVGAPTIDASKEQTAGNPRFRKSVYAHYGVEAPMGKKRGDGMKRKAGDMKEKAEAVKGEVKKVVRDVKDVVDKV